MSVCRTLIVAFGLCAAAWAQTVPQLATDINEAVVKIPVIVNGKPSGDSMVGTVFKPDGNGPFPFAVINHGRASSRAERAQVPRWRYTSQARWLVKRGFVVIVPTRRGYGDTGGSDVETIYACSNPWFKEAMAGGVESVLSAVEFTKTLPYVDPKRFVVIGQSVGGFLSVGVAGANPEGLRAIVNFAGGHGSQPDKTPGMSCAPEKLARVFSDAGKTAKVPTLWIYTENDISFGPEIARAWHQAFTDAGGKAELKLLPPFETDGHRLFARGAAVWQPIVDAFLTSVEF